MTDEIIQKLDLLYRCRFQPGSWAKRFVSAMHNYRGDFSEKQVYWIHRLYYMYRRQIPAIASRLGIEAVPEFAIPNSLDDPADVPTPEQQETLEQLQRWSGG